MAEPMLGILLYCEWQGGGEKVKVPRQKLCLLAAEGVVSYPFDDVIKSIWARQALCVPIGRCGAFSASVNCTYFDLHSLFYDGFEQQTAKTPIFLLFTTSISFVIIGFRDCSSILPPNFHEINRKTKKESRLWIRILKKCSPTV